jgi:hypothetical protein
MASTGNVFPTVGASVDRASSTAWTNPGNVVSDNATDATAAVPTDYLVTSGYGFSIPADAIILGVTVRVEASETGTGSSNYVPQLHSDTTPTLIGSAKGAVTVSGTTKVISTTGGIADLWGAALTPAIVNAAGFGVSIWSTDATNTLAVDFVTIAIEYELPNVVGEAPPVPDDEPEDFESLSVFPWAVLALVASGVLALCASYPLEAEPEELAESYAASVFDAPADEFVASVWADAEPETETEDSAVAWPEFADDPDYLPLAAYPAEGDESADTEESAVAYVEEVPAAPAEFIPVGTWEELPLEETADAYAQVVVLAPQAAAGDTTEPVVFAFEPPDEDPGTEDSAAVQAVFVDGPAPDVELIPTFADSEFQVEHEPETPASSIGYVEIGDNTAELDTDFGDEQVEIVTEESWTPAHEFETPVLDTTEPILSVLADFSGGEETDDSEAVQAEFVDGEPPVIDYVTWLASEEQPADDIEAESYVGAVEPPVVDTTEPIVPVLADFSGGEETDESAAVQAAFADGEPAEPEVVVTSLPAEEPEPDERTEESWTLGPALESPDTTEPILPYWAEFSGSDETDDSEVAQAEFLDRVLVGYLVGKVVVTPALDGAVVVTPVLETTLQVEPAVDAAPIVRPIA